MRVRKRLHVKHATPRTKPVAGSDGVAQSEVRSVDLGNQDHKGSLSRIDVVRYMYFMEFYQFHRDPNRIATQMIIRR